MLLAVGILIAMFLVALGAFSLTLAALRCLEAYNDKK